MGTDGYIPPEGPGAPGGDIYSLGKVLYELVTAKDRLDFPELPDEAIIAINDFLEEFYIHFQERYFAQMHRYYHDQPRPDPDLQQMTLPLSDPPF